MEIYKPGTMIANQYEVVSKPMMGGMGIVYFCLDHGNEDRPVALKTFQSELLPDRAARDRFLREGTVWVELMNHPHIVRCYEVMYFDPTAFLVLELIAKEQNMPDASLRSWLIPGQPLPIEQALLFALQIARGMQHATEKIPGFVHRDLKPENVLVGVDKLQNTNINRLRVTDFGLATILKDEIGKIKNNRNSNDFRHTKLTYGAVGTPLYMAPEQWKGEHVGVFTDIYAFGCILFEMLTGNYLANGKTINQLEEAHCNGNLNARSASLPEGIDTLLANCLELSSGKRYHDWGELIKTLETVCSKQSKSDFLLFPNAEETSAVAQTIQDSATYNAIGSAYFDLGKASAAIDYFNKALIISRKSQESLAEGATLSNLGNAFFQLGDKQKALECFEQLKALSIKLDDRYLERAALNNLGNLYQSTGDVKQALSFYEHALEIDHANNDHYWESTTSGNIGTLYLDIGDFRRAIGYFERVLLICRKANDLRGVGRTLGNLGLAYKYIGNMQEAIKCQEQRREIALEIGDRDGEASAMGNLGNIYLDIGDSQKAIVFFEQALIIDHEISDLAGESSGLTGLGSANIRLGEVHQKRGLHEQARRYFEQAKENYEQALIMSRKLNNRKGEGRDLGNLGNANLLLGNTQQAIGYHEQALKILRDVEDLAGAAMTTFNIAFLYWRQGDSTRALSLAQESAHVFSQMGLIPNAKQAQQLIAQIQRGGTQGTTNSAQSAFEDFQHTTSFHDMQVASAKYPFMTDKQFIQAIEEIINEQVPPEHKPAYEERLSWLKQIAGKQKPSPLGSLLGKK